MKLRGCWVKVAAMLGRGAVTVRRGRYFRRSDFASDVSASTSRVISALMAVISSALGRWMATSGGTGAGGPGGIGANALRPGLAGRAGALAGAVVGAAPAGCCWANRVGAAERAARRARAMRGDRFIFAPFGKRSGGWTIPSNGRHVNGRGKRGLRGVLSRITW